MIPGLTIPFLLFKTLDGLRTGVQGLCHKIMELRKLGFHCITIEIYVGVR